MDKGSSCPMMQKPTHVTKKFIFGGIIVVIVAAVILVATLLSSQSFSGVVNDMLNEYPYANNSRAQDDSYLKIDTNPYDKDADELTYVELSTFDQVQTDSLNGIKFVNERLGFTDALYSKMMDTTALMGVQTEENDKYRVSWTYHPDNGLEVMYERK